MNLNPIDFRNVLRHLELPQLAEAYKELAYELLSRGVPLGPTIGDTLDAVHRAHRFQLARDGRLTTSSGAPAQR